MPSWAQKLQRQMTKDRPKFNYITQWEIQDKNTKVKDKNMKCTK